MSGRAGREGAGNSSSRRGASRWPIHRPAAPGVHRLSVVIPAYHEVDAISATIARVRQELAPIASEGGIEVVVVDDGSGDGTAAAAEAGGADHVIEFPVNQGKGAAVRAGAVAAQGRTVAFTDADLSYAPAQIADLLIRVEEGWDMVVGSRRHGETTTVAEARRLRDLGGRAINVASRAVLSGQYRDTQCGLKAFRSDAARLLFSHAKVDGFAFDIELFHLAERYGLALTEVPVQVENFERSTVRVARDAARLLADVARIGFDSTRGVYDLDPDDLDLALPAPVKERSPLR